ncbi:uncharacterized protein LOC131049462 isoform X2 [Cryptomeria japonica]|uniref:uncharacterized protein LOC131049462 isoform X2 n=1 Tax=Cryptomeria japonica TaxID=3369 RepID=UPI0027DA7109|nr:uncharacterized protein LOC131049462 isoform X2 [Cryptomeria japonica]
MIPEREWKDLVLDGKDKTAKKKGETPSGQGRMLDTSKATKARLEKCEHHKLGFGGYMNLVARIGSEFNRVPTEEDLRMAFQQGYGVVAERLRLLSGQAKAFTASDTQASNDNIAHDIGMQRVEGGTQPGNEEHVERDQHVEHDQARQDQEHDVALSEDVERDQHVEHDQAIHDQEHDVAPSEPPLQRPPRREYMTRHRLRLCAEGRTTEGGQMI